MQELIERLQREHGLDPAQSYNILNTVKEFIKEKFPMVGGAIDNLFPQQPATPAGDTGTTEGPAQKGGSFLDRISDYIPGDLREKAEQIAKNNLGGMFGSEKKDQ